MANNQQLPTLASVLGSGKAPKLPTLSSLRLSSASLPTLGDVLSGRVPVAKGPASGGTSSGHHGSLLGNFVHDAESSLASIPKGAESIASSSYHDLAHQLEHPSQGKEYTPGIGSKSELRKNVVDPILENYKATYGPLVQGHLGRFYSQFHAHPLGPVLDLATLVTGGAGAAAKAGSALEKAGMVAEDSRLAQLGKARDITTPDFAKQVGQEGKDIVLKRSSTNPAIRARQSAVNAGLNKLAGAPGGIGRAGQRIQAGRIIKAISRNPAREAARVKLGAVDFNQAFDKLTADEKAAWHLKARAVHPAVYADHLAKQEGASEATINTLRSPKVQKLWEHPSPNLQDALDKGRALSDELTALKVAAGHVSEKVAAESPYRLLRITSGAEFKPVMADNSEKLLAQTHASGVGLIDQPGKDIGTLAKALEANGEHQPFYVPDSAEIQGATKNAFARKVTGLSEPAKSGASRQNLGILANKGLIALHENPLGREVHHFANYTEGSVLHDELVKHAAVLPHGEPLPRGYDYLKLNRGELSAPYTEKIAAEFEHALEPGTADKVLTRDSSAPDIAETEHGRLVVPSAVRKILENRSLSFNGTLQHLLYNQPTSVWKHLVLGLRPAFFGNITIGNSILGALQMAPGVHGIAAWINQIVPNASRVLGPKLSKATMREVLPEQVLGTFGRSAGFAASTKGMRLAKRAYEGVMPATIRYEDVLRRAMAEGWAKATPEVRTALRHHGGDINAALREVAQTHPEVINTLSKRIDDALGNYRTYNKLERNIKQLIPFYGWERHIVKSTARIAGERPGRLNALTKTGQLGQAENDKQLGPLPSFLAGSIAINHLPGIFGKVEPGRTPLLTTHSLNPFASTADLMRLGEGLVSGQAGTHSEELASGLNPFVQAIIEQITGRSLLTGATLKHGPHFGLLGNVPLNTVEALPQATILADLLGHGKKSTPNSLYQKDLQTALAAYLGASVKKTNLQTAAQMAANEGKPPR